MNALKLLWLKAKLRYEEKTIESIAQKMLDVNANASAFTIYGSRQITKGARRASSLRAQIVEMGGKP